jgi:hypothetical protein
LKFTLNSEFFLWTTRQGSEKFFKYFFRFFTNELSSSPKFFSSFFSIFACHWTHSRLLSFKIIFPQKATHFTGYGHFGEMAGATDFVMYRIRFLEEFFKYNLSWLVITNCIVITNCLAIPNGNLTKDDLSFIANSWGTLQQLAAA